MSSPCKDRSEKRPESRSMQLARVLLIAELLAPLRHGATIGELMSDVSDTLGVRFCERTIRRDLEALESLGVVELVHPNRRPMVAKWARDRFRSSVVESLAIAASERRGDCANLGGIPQ